MRGLYLDAPAWTYYVFFLQGAEHRAGSEDENENDEKTTSY